MAYRELQHVRVDHRRAHVPVPEQLLNGTDVVAVLEQMRRERVPQRMGSGALGEPRPAGGVLHRALQDGLVEVVAAALARYPVVVDARRRENPLPGPLPAGVRVLPEQRGR
jgi:hypothetical protein